MCDIKATICMISCEFYVTSQPHFKISQDCIHHIISTLYMTSHPLYMTSHTLYLWHHSHTNYDKTPIMFVTLNSVYNTPHMVNEWQHNECIWHDTQCICVIKPTWLMTSQPMYEWNHTPCMYDNIGTLYDIISTLFFSFFLICGGFCHILKWNSHGLHVFPIRIPPPTSLFTVPSRFSQCTTSERLSHASNLGWWSVSP